MPQQDYIIGEDSWMDGANTTTTHGADTSLRWGSYQTGLNKGDERPILRKDLSALGDVVIEDARFYFYVHNVVGSNTPYIECWRILRDWVEAQVCWANWSTGNAWTIGGADGEGSDYDGYHQPVEMFLPDSTGWKDIDLACIVADAIDNRGGDLDFRGDCTDVTETDRYVDFYSSEYGSSPPFVRITYHQRADREQICC